MRIFLAAWSTDSGKDTSYARAGANGASLGPITSNDPYHKYTT